MVSIVESSRDTRRTVLRKFGCSWNFHYSMAKLSSINK